MLTVILIIMFSALPIALLILTWPYSYSDELKELRDEYKQWKKEMI